MQFLQGKAHSNVKLIGPVIESIKNTPAYVNEDIVHDFVTIGVNTLKYMLVIVRDNVCPACKGDCKIF